MDKINFDKLNHENFVLVRECTAPAYHGKRTIARVVCVHPTYKRNVEDGHAVYRVKDFCLYGEVRGWSLMPREYTTLKGLIRAAKKIGCRVELL